MGRLPSPPPLRAPLARTNRIAVNCQYNESIRQSNLLKSLTCIVTHSRVAVTKCKLTLSAANIDQQANN